MLAISTMWNAYKQPDGAALLDELKAFGFEAIELSRHLTAAQIEQLRPLFRDGGRPCSIHNFCPRDESPRRLSSQTKNRHTEEDTVQLASLDVDERKEAVRRTVKTMELATELEISTVVLHLGHVDTYDRTHVMIELYTYGEREFEAFRQKVTEATEWRRRKEAKHRDAVLRSLDELNEHALRMELYLAIENRPRYYQIPNFDEFGIFFEEFYGSPMRYWHDVAHAAFQEQLGLCRAQEWLNAYAEHLIGVNLHDTQGLEPYHPPGTGELDWDELFTHLPADVLKVLEIRHGDAEQVQEAKELCESLTQQRENADEHIPR